MAHPKGEPGSDGRYTGHPTVPLMFPIGMSIGEEETRYQSSGTEFEKVTPLPESKIKVVSASRRVSAAIGSKSEFLISVALPFKLIFNVLYIQVTSCVEIEAF